MAWLVVPLTKLRELVARSRGNIQAISRKEAEERFMARIKGVSESEASDEVREIFAEQKRRHGFVSNAAQVSAVRPTIQKGVQALAQGIQQSGLIAQDLRNLVCVRTAQINGCPY
jgi:hypothetical protein